eukprot:1653680-Rhodomonas_salina.1
MTDWGRICTKECYRRREGNVYITFPPTTSIFSLNDFGKRLIGSKFKGQRKKLEWRWTERDSGNQSHGRYHISYPLERAGNAQRGINIHSNQSLLRATAYFGMCLRLGYTHSIFERINIKSRSTPLLRLYFSGALLIRRR